jgi:hypothetical protein
MYDVCSEDGLRRKCFCSCPNKGKQILVFIQIQLTAFSSELFKNEAIISLLFFPDESPAKVSAVLVFAWQGLVGVFYSNFFLAVHG